MLYAPRKITWWIAVATAFLSALLLVAYQETAAIAAALLALVGSLLLIVATKIKRL